MASSVAVKQMIRNLLATEDPAAPLSDQQVVQALRGSGLAIARRTVAKYREELGAPPSHQRRRIAREGIRPAQLKRAVSFYEEKATRMLGG